MINHHRHPAKIKSQNKIKHMMLHINTIMIIIIIIIIIITSLQTT